MSIFDRHRVALAVTEELVRDPRVKSVAITGSVARGDSCAASDVDLWVLGNRNRRERFDHRRVEVTLLWQTPKRALTDDTLLRFEVDDAIVLHDPGGHFRRVKVANQQRRGRLRNVAINETAHVIKEFTQRARRQTPERAVALLREVGRRGAALRIYLDLGWRVPKWRHFEKHLNPTVLSALTELQALPVGDGPWRRLTRHMRESDAALRSLRERARHYPPRLPSLEHVRWLSKKGAREQAVALVREALQEVAGGKRTPAPAVELWRLAHGFDRRAPVRADIRRTAQAAADLLETLGVEAELDPRWGLTATLRELL